MAHPTRLVTPEKREDDLETSLRPLALSDFTGQRAARPSEGVQTRAGGERAGVHTPGIQRGTSRQYFSYGSPNFRLRVGSS